MDLIDPVPARQFTHEAPDAGVGLVGHVRQKDLEIQTKTTCFSGRHERRGFHVNDMATTSRAMDEPGARSGDRR
ncbi:hypothetical protein [Aquibium sp. ELW1220]|uniref:hypothetical protein n=1 Tax=Aquibium sp. ELW1220 TaxID=2976766 RepID=UPI0025B02966|nr:hypothetical protein [Aquibium sp. ELW1220]MDN2582142.1 hypothetical protein [Aquibium sp. ELW1220]